MLGTRGNQQGLFEADTMYGDMVGEDSFYGWLAAERGRLFRDEDFADFHCPDNGRPSVPPVYVAYRQDLSKESSMAHIHVRERYELGEPEVVRTMAEIAALADIARALMRSGDHEELARTINRNFDLRSRIFDIRPEDRQMVDRARQVGASCKFCGSGGAVVGTYDGDEMLEALRSAMEGAGYRFMAPEIAPNHD